MVDKNYVVVQYLEYERSTLVHASTLFRQRGVMIWAEKCGCFDDGVKSLHAPYVNVKHAKQECRNRRIKEEKESKSARASRNEIEIVNEHRYMQLEVKE